MNLSRPTAASTAALTAAHTTKPSSAAPIPVQVQTAGGASTLPSWVARTSLESGRKPAHRRVHGHACDERFGVSAALRALRDPQSWITAIAVLTLVGLSGGAFESEDSHSERSAIHLHSGMTNDAVVAELSSSQR